jgi:hypothetical protein
MDKNQSDVNELNIGDLIDVNGTFYGERIGICVVIGFDGRTYLPSKYEQLKMYKVYSSTLNRELRLTPKYNKVTILSRICV